MTTTNPLLLSSITTHVRTVGTSRPAVRAARAWAIRSPVLVGFAHPAAVAAAGLSASPTDRDRLLQALLRVGAGDGWVELTVLAMVAPRLGWVVSRWAAAGVPSWDLADLEADLVAECLALIRSVMRGPGPVPDRPGLVLVDRAWTVVRDRRVTARRRASRTVAITGSHDRGWAGDRRTGVDLLAAAITDARTAGAVGAGPGRVLFLTRAVGLTTTEAAAQVGTDPGSVRALRSRATRQLTAHLGLDHSHGLGRKPAAGLEEVA